MDKEFETQCSKTNQHKSVVHSQNRLQIKWISSFLCNSVINGFDRDISWQEVPREFCFISFVCLFVSNKGVDSVVEDHSNGSRCGGQNRGEALN